MRVAPTWSAQRTIIDTVSNARRTRIAHITGSKAHRTRTGRSSNNQRPRVEQASHTDPWVERASNEQLPIIVQSSPAHASPSHQAHPRTRSHGSDTGRAIIERAANKLRSCVVFKPASNVDPLVGRSHRRLIDHAPNMRESRIEPTSRMAPSVRQASDDHRTRIHQIIEQASRQHRPRVNLDHA